MSANIQDLASFVNGMWDHEVMPALCDYLKIPNKSPDFDSLWCSNGYMHRAINGFKDWANQCNINGLTSDLIELDGRTPLLLIEVEGQRPETILLYGHCDKQPEAEGWDDDKGPWSPVEQHGRLYGRGVADDGYAMFSALTAIKACQRKQQPHPRFVVLIECCEESGSTDLPFYLDHLAQRLGTPSLVVCLDSGCGNYEQLWNTHALRGMVHGVLSVQVLTEGVHSGLAGGMVPSSFRLVRQLLERIEDSSTGDVLLQSANLPLAKQQHQQASSVAKAMGDAFYRTLPWHGHTHAVHHKASELLLNNAWRPALSVTGADGMPATAKAGNVMRPLTCLKLSLRLPPGADSAQVAAEMKQRLEHDPPYHCSVQFKVDGASDGWQAPALSEHLEKIMQDASLAAFGQPMEPLWCGGGIPLMNLLANYFPDAKFWVTGVLGPESNAHGPNECLHLAYVKQLTHCVAYVLSEY